MGEPIAVAFVEVVPETAAFKAQAESQIRSQLAATRIAVPPAAGAGVATGQLQKLAAAATETATADQLLTKAQEQYNAALVAGEGLQSAAAKAHVQKAAAAEADATAQRALFAITEETGAAITAEIDALVAATGALAAKTAAEERAVFGTRAHTAASREAAEAILAESATMTGLRGASLGVNPAFLAATAGAITFFKSLEIASNFEEQMHQIEFATHATEEQLKEAANTAVALGADLQIPGASAERAAETLRELTESGKSLNESAVIARPVLQLQAAAELDVASSVKTTVEILDAYNLTADRSVDVTDSLTTATKSGAGSAEDYASALAAIAPVANSFGLDVRTTTGFLIQLSEGGVAASQTGTLLRQSLLKLANPTKGAREELARLGLTLHDLLDAQGNLRPDAFVRLGEAMDGLNRAQQRAALSQIFSLRGVRAVLPLVEAGRSGFEAAQEEAQKYGSTLDEAKEKERGLGGQAHELHQDLSDIGLVLGNAVIPAVEDFVSALDQSIGPMEGFIERIQRMTGESGGLPKALGDAERVIVGTFQGRTLEFGTLHFKDEEANAQIDKVREKFDGLISDFQKSQKGPVFLNELVLGLQKLRDSLDVTKPAEQAAAQGIDDFIQKVQDAGKLPPIPISFQPVPELEKAREAAHKAGNTVVEGLIQTAELGFPALAQLGLDMTNAIGAGIDKGDLGPHADRLVSTFTASLATQTAVLEAGGAGDAELLANLRQRQAVAQRHLEAEQRKAAAGEAGHGDKTIQAAAAAKKAIDDRIQQILDQQAADAESAQQKAKAAADKIIRAGEERDRDFLDAINSGQTRREARVSAAGATAALADDIKANDALRVFLRKSIEQVQDRIREAREAGRDTRSLAAELQTLRLAKAEVRREIARLRAERRQEADQNRVESAQLDVELAGIGADAGSDDRTQASINREVAARQRLIAALRKAQDHVKKGTLEWKRLRNQIAEEQAAIADLQKQNAKKHEDVTTLQKQEFEFLQTIQGFSANLLGNLIPGTATAGLVGGRPGGAPPPQTTTTAGAFGQKRPEAASARVQPVTTGQGNTQIDLLRKIHHELVIARRGPDHPEAREQRRRGAAAGDFSYQGTHGM